MSVFHIPSIHQINKIIKINIYLLHCVRIYLYGHLIITIFILIQMNSFENLKNILNVWKMSK
jgi:phage-related holin